MTHFFGPADAAAPLWFIAQTGTPAPAPSAPLPDPPPSEGSGWLIVIFWGAVIAVIIQIWRKRGRTSAQSFQRVGFWVIGGLFGATFVRTFLLNEVESIGFSVVMQNLSKMSSNDFNTVLNSSTFGKCFLGFVFGMAAGEFGWTLYSKNKIRQLSSANGNGALGSVADSKQKPSAESRLTELLLLKEKGLISNEEFERKKAEVVREL